MPPHPPEQRSLRRNRRKDRRRLGPSLPAASRRRRLPTPVERRPDPACVSGGQQGLRPCTVAERRWAKSARDTGTGGRRRGAQAHPRAGGQQRATAAPPHRARHRTCCTRAARLARATPGPTPRTAQNHCATSSPGTARASIARDDVGAFDGARGLLAVAPEASGRRRARARGQARGGRARARRAARSRPPPDRRRARRRQDDARARARARRRRRDAPRAVHERSAAERRGRRARLRPAHRRVRVPAGPDLRQRALGGRDQPREPAHAVRAARGDERGAGVDRRHDACRCPSRSSSSPRRTRRTSPAPSRCPSRSSIAS